MARSLEQERENTMSLKLHSRKSLILPIFAGKPLSREGFTLLEVVIAMVILALGFLGLAALIANTALQIKTSREVTIATNDARSTLEFLNGISYVDLLASNYQLPQFNNLEGENVQVATSNAGINSTQIVATVTWNSGGRVLSTRLNVARNNL